MDTAAAPLHGTSAEEILPSVSGVAGAERVGTRLCSRRDSTAGPRRRGARSGSRDGHEKTPQSSPSPLEEILHMNSERAETRNDASELHRHDGNHNVPARAERSCKTFARGQKQISSLSLFRPRESRSRALPEIDSEGVSSSRLSARPDLQLRQRNTGMPENLRSLYGEDSAAHLQRGGNPALHHWWTLPRYTERNRRLSSYSSKCFFTRIFNYEC